MYNDAGGGGATVALNHEARERFMVCFSFLFYRDSVCLCARVNVYKYVRIISYGSQCLSFTACNRMSIFFFFPPLLLHRGWG